MIITFCGHADFRGNEEYEKKIMRFLEDTISDARADIYLGGYGGFDEFAHACCLKFKKENPNVSLILVTPYLSLEYQRNHLAYQKEKYDAILYAEIEDKPLRFAIKYRNRYMVDKADHVVAYVNHALGGAYKTYKYARQKKKHIFNLSKLPE